MAMVKVNQVTKNNNRNQIMPEKYITIVIPLYNKEKSVRATLESVLAQSYTDYEVIVVDDGSTDNSLKVVQELISRLENGDRRLNIVSQANAGVSAARNKGIQEAKSQYVAFLDADDIWDKDYLAEQVKMIHDFPEAKMWSVNFAATSNGEMCHQYNTGLPDGFRGYVKDYFQRQGHESELAHPSSVVIRKEVFDTIGMFDERIKYSEDSDMWFRMNAVYKTAFYDRIMVSYEQEAENRAMNRRRAMRYFLPYYVDKYKEPIFRQNNDCYIYVNRWCAIKIKEYFFSNDSKDRNEAKEAASKMDYSVMPFKYRLFFRLPFKWAKILYELDKKRMSKVKKSTI